MVYLSRKGNFEAHKHMKKTIYGFSVILALSLASCASQTFLPTDVGVSKSIAKVETFPDIPSNYSFFDYRAKAQAGITVFPPPAVKR